MIREPRIEELVGMSIELMREQWRSTIGSEPPRIAADLLRRILGHALQENAMGGLSPTHRQALRRLAAGKENTTLKRGVRLIRQWNGRTIAVTVGEEGFVWDDRTYRSLSAIAREVTGTSWSGPRFFGLHDNG